MESLRAVYQGSCVIRQTSVLPGVTEGAAGGKSDRTKFERHTRTIRTR